MKTIAEYAKSILFVLIILQIAPPIVQSVKENYLSFLTAHTNVGRVTIDSVVTDSTFYAKTLKKFFKDPEIKAILLRIDCPGGASGSCQALFAEIQELKKRFPKPIVTVTENICASGGYYIACATDSIIASRSCLVGGVGTTLTTLFNFKELAQHWHVKTNVISAGLYKNTTNQFTDMTEEQRALLQSIADNSYLQFATDVAKTRKLSVKEKDKWANGKLFTGQQALKLHMIDKTGSYSEALKTIKSMAPIEGSVHWVDPHEETSFFDKLFGSVRSGFMESATNTVCNTLEQRYSRIQS